MKCHYINAPGVGMVLIPGCWGAAISNDLSHCTCKKLAPETIAEYERQLEQEWQRKAERDDMRKKIFNLKNQKP